MKERTWSSIFREFREVTNISEEIISDWRPCQPPYSDVSIPMAVIVWLTNGSQIIYKTKDDHYK